MNFLSKTLSTFTGSSIPYTFKEKIVDPITPTSSIHQIDSSTVWSLYNGINPKDSSPVSIFEFNLRDTRVQRWELLARNAFKKLKTIKYPGLVSVVDFIENDSYLYIVTERVIPLALYIKEQDTKLHTDAVTAGIYEVARSLRFINEDCNSVHGGLNYYSSVFVNSQGDWKLFGFELVTNLQSDPDQALYRLSQNMPGNTSHGDIDMEAVRRDPKKYDGYLLGQLIYASFNNGVVDTTVKIPVKLQGPAKRLNAKRNTVAQYLKETEQYHEQNMIIRFNHQLSELKFIKENDAKLEFFKHELPQYTEEDIYPPGFLNYKLLPELINQYHHLSKSQGSTSITNASIVPSSSTGSNGSEVHAKQETMSVLLNLVIKFGVKLSEDEFNKQIKPLIFEAFAQNDRAIRLILLTHLPDYQHFLTDSDVQYKIFTPLVTGFQDTNFMIRETTLKSITIVIDKISVKQVNQELLRILAKSQMDPKPSIRVNTLVLIVKISSKIYANSKNNVLITALSKSLRDSFVPCKMTALSGFESLIDEFSLEEICSKILGHLAISLMDKKSSKVRKAARKVFDLYLSSVEAHAKDLPVLENEDDEDEEEREFYKRYAPQQQKETVADDSAAKQVAESTGGGFGWGMMSKLTSLGGSSTNINAVGAGGQLNHDFNHSTPDITRVSTPTQRELPILDIESSNDGWGDGDGEIEVDEDWIGNNEDDINKEEENRKELGRDIFRQPPKIVENTRKLNLGRSTDVPTGRQPLRKPLKSTTSLKLGSASRAAEKKTKPKSALQLNLKLDDDQTEDGWDETW